MQINADDSIADIPILEVRDALRHVPSVPYSYPEFFARRLGISQKRARELIAGLVEQGYVELVGRRPKEWIVTTKGRALANAKAAKPIQRTTADRALKAFLDRVKEVNSNEYYLYKLTKVVLFGSYLSGQQRLGDVDIAIEIQRKTEDFEEHQRLNAKRVKEAEARGRNFSWWQEQDNWGEQETLLFLKSRSRSLSLHYWQGHQKFIEASTYKVLYDETEQQQASGE